MRWKHAVYIIQKEKEACAAREEKYQSFVDALLNYGEYAKIYFSARDEKRAYDNAKDNPKEYGMQYKTYKSKLFREDAGITDEGYTGTSLLLKDKVILRHYFTEWQPGSEQKDAYWYIEQAYNPTDFTGQIGDHYDFTINDYIATALDSDDRYLKNICCALYEHGQAASNLEKNG